MTEKFESGLLPVLPLKEMVIFPHSITPLFVIRPKSLAAVEEALSRGKKAFVSCQRNAEEEAPSGKDLNQHGTVVEILQVLRVPDGSAKVLVEGEYVARAVEFITGDQFVQALVVKVPVEPSDPRHLEAHQRGTMALFERYTRLSEKVPEDLFASIKAIQDPLALLYAVANYTALKTELKQRILEVQSIEEKFLLLNKALDEENQILELENKIVGQVKTQIGKSQREYYLNEQLKAIEKELGISAAGGGELTDLVRRAKSCGMSKEGQARVEREVQRLSRMAPVSPEATVARTYIEWLVDIPWKKATKDRIDLARARKVLDADHYGLEKIKERIIEYLAVTKMVGSVRGQILCFIGPPGVGKTSLGRSIARCIGRKFTRMSLGGVRDEAEIRGHRRTYVGAMPGKIIQSMKKVGAMNPVFLLDEIDKMSSDFRGDPASALLEVLDPEQNNTFSDHYLEVEYDLSRIMFICTANTMEGIPLPLLDRMEIIRLPGYTEDEKRHIATRFLLPRQMKEHGLDKSRLRISDAILHKIITGYTREAGVRDLDRQVATLCRKTVKGVVDKELPATLDMDEARLREFLGPQKFRDTRLDKSPEIGNALGLAWTEVGGELLSVETTIMKGKGDLVLTGKLGEVMRESARTALSYIRAHAAELDIDPDFHSQVDIHVHLPEGAIPKDGPSAGITMATSMASVLSRRPVRQDLAMTGEVTLRGRVLKIGGLKEKALAAHRSQITTVLIPEDNLDDLEEISREIRDQMTFIPVRSLAQVFDLALAPQPTRSQRGKAESRSSSATV